MKYLISLLLTFPLWASPLEGMPCSTSIKVLVKEWKASGEWNKELQGGLQNSFYSSPTDEVGEWVLLREIPNGAVVSKASESGRIEASFIGKNCVKEVKTYPHSKIMGPYVGDEFIKSFVKKNKSGAIYVWSPRMGLSVGGIAEIKKAASSMKLPLLVLLDKDVTPMEFQALKKKLGENETRRVDSFEFKMRKLGQHFPALLVFKDGKILSEVKYGYEKDDRYQLDLAHMLGKR